MALFLEALRCVEEGLASPQEVDEVVRSCFGFRLPFFGPFQIADMAGLDVYAGAYDALAGQFGDRLGGGMMKQERGCDAEHDSDDRQHPPVRPDLGSPGGGRPSGCGLARR